MPSRVRAAARSLPLVAIVAAAGGLAAYYAAQAEEWVVMADELQTSKLATSIGRTLSPAPTIHGRYYHALSQLYPLVIAPFFGSLPVPAAFEAAHVLNGFLLASAAWPAYLLGRAVTGSRAGGYFAAALTAFVPWLVLASTLLTENAAYPAFVWALFLVHRALARPSPGRDVWALVGVALVFLARTQLFVMAFVLPVALVADELGYAAATAPRGGRRAALRDGLRRIPVQHPVLVAVYAAGLVLLVVLAAVGLLGNVVGTYAVTFHGDLLPSGVWHAMIVHLDYVVVGAGVVPFVLAVAWALATLARPDGRSAHAFAVLVAVLVPLLTFEVSSFDVRFTPGGFPEDRYLFYVVPVLAVGAAAALLQPGRPALVVGVGAALAVLAGMVDYADRPVIYWAAPAAAFQRAFGALAVSPVVAVAAFAVAVAAALALRSRHALAVVGAALALFGAVEAVYVFERFGVPVSTRPLAIPTVPADWIDETVPDGASVAIVSNGHVPYDFWWDAEFWNTTVDRALRVDGHLISTPFPTDVLAADPATGRVRGLPTHLLLLAGRETRFGLAGSTLLRAVGPLRLVSVARPYRLDWATRGTAPDGWTRPGRPVQVRLYGHGRRELREVVLTVRAVRDTGFAARTGRSVVQGLATAGAVDRVRFTTCVPARGFAQATLTVPGAVRIPDGRLVGALLERIEVRSLARTCPG